MNINDSVNTEDISETIPAHTKRVSNNLPLMPYYLQELTTVVDKPGEIKFPPLDSYFSLVERFFIILLFLGSQPTLAFESTSLRDRVEYSMKMGSVLNVLWKNIGTLDAAAEMKL